MGVVDTVVTARFRTDPSYIQEDALFTMKAESAHEFSPELFFKYLRSEHSPVRSCVMEINLFGLPSHVSVHFVRHKVGIEHFVSTNRPDRTGKARSACDTVNHRMIANPQALINMARKRLCSRASSETREAMELIRMCLVSSRDPYLCCVGGVLVPDCEYRGGTCYEFKSCGRKKSAWRNDDV